MKILITGGASGIGKATAELLASRGAAVAIGDLDGDGAESVAAALAGDGATAVGYRLDVSDSSSVADFVARAAGELGGVNGLINVAGLQISAPLDQQTEEDWDRTMAVNAKGPWLMTRAALPALTEAAPDAAVVNVASLAAIKGVATMPAYSASKGAIAAFTRSAAVELAPRGIRVNCVCPGWVDTPFNNPIIASMGGREAQAEAISQTVPLGRQATPAELAPTLVHLVGPDSAYTTGQCFNPDGGATA
jgi:NAD(P)-dependent dehydrogenase (short-subunit alcohol dehydrogenase family)